MSASNSRLSAARRRLLVAALAPTLAAAAAVAAAPMSATGPDHSPQIISMILLRKSACDRWQPGFRDLSAQAFQRWRRFGNQRIRAVERSAEFRARLAEIERLPVEHAGAQDRRDAARTCGAEFIAYVDSLGRDPDPRFTTPEGTWRAFVSALRAGDRTEALSMMTGSARDGHREEFERQTPETLRQTAAAFVAFEPQPPIGSYHVARARLANGRSATVFFEREWNGDWRIAAL